MGVRRTVRWFDPVVVVLLLASIAHAARRDYVDLVTFLFVCAVIVAERLFRRRLRPPQVAHQLHGLRFAALLVGMVVFAMAGSAAPHGGAVIRALLSAVGAVVFVQVLRHPAAPGGEPVGVTGWWAWLVALLLLALWELTNFLLQPDPMTSSVDHPTLSDVVTPLLQTRVDVFVVLVLWSASGVWLVRRALAGGDEPVAEVATDTLAEAGR